MVNYAYKQVGTTRSLLQIVWILSRNFVDIFRLNSLVGSYLLLRISLGCVYDMLNVVVLLRWWCGGGVGGAVVHSETGSRSPPPLCSVAVCRSHS